MADGKHFNIVQTVASGGTAVLYKAVQVSLDRIVAIKRLHPHLTQDENFTRRFVLEAKAAASLDHENIVRVIDFGVEDGNYQMVMEFVEGESVKEVLERWRPVNAELTLALVHQVCRGLEHAHAKGIVHRDIKPGNIMLTKTGVAKITDFGLAKLTQGGTMQTAADSILGTPLYMSPEQAFGESVDQRSDLFSLGTVLYELLTGRQPFVSENYMGVIQNIIHKEIPAIRDLNPEVAEEIEAIAMKALAKNRDDRFQSATDFREAIEQVLGLESLSHARTALPALLERGVQTRVLHKSATPSAVISKSSTWSTVSRTKKKKRAGIPVWLTVAAVSVVMGVAAGWFLWSRSDRGPGPMVSRGDVQESSLMETSGFDPAPGTTGPLAADVPADSATVAAADSSAIADTGAGTSTPGENPADPEAAATTSLQPPAMPWKAPEPAASSSGAREEPAATPAPGATDTPAPENAPHRTAREDREPEKPFREGYLLVNAEPSAQVWVNGVYRGEANPTLRLSLPAGTHSIECRDPRHESYHETLRIVAGELSQRNIVLKKLKGIISLATTEGAEFYVDGGLIGITPITRPIEVAAGTHTLTIKKDGYYTWSSEVVVEPSGTLPLRITLSPRF